MKDPSSCFNNWETKTVKELMKEMASIIGMGVITPEAIEIAERYTEIIVKKTFRTVASMNMEEDNETETQA